MPYQAVNGAQIYYETFGADAPDGLPLLLIHGSTITGSEDWGAIATLLSTNRKVIIPDCRGHGKSTNPNLSYSFLEMAADAAGLVQALGYVGAHLVGHSNGGNIALMALLEYPQIFQTAVLQAANAYVSQDLVDIEPAKFDPQRVEREAPGWMERMIALHGQTHGQDYWKRLLELTLNEIITQPNYSPQDLQRVQRPVLVIQGEKDAVNATSRHGQFIASHIPFAEFWSPKGIGHNVHKEIPLAWIERVLNFIDRRGDPVNEAIYHLGQERYADKRETIFDVQAKKDLTSGVLVLKGQVLTPEQRQVAVQTAASCSGVPLERIGDSQLRVLLDDSTPWALVNRPVSDLRREPRSLAERVSQALLGESLRILQAEDEWSLVRLEHDGYMGWIHSAALHPCTEAEVRQYQASCNAVVMTGFLPARSTPVDSSGVSAAMDTSQAGKLFFGLRVAVVSWQADAAQVRLPDGRLWWVDRSGLLPLEQPLQPNPQGITAALKYILRFVGVPYLWGGRSPYGCDCSGLAQTFLSLLGVQITRDADQQFRAGVPVTGQPLPGDLLFFADKSASRVDARHQAVTHVAISLGSDLVVHATGAAWGTTINSLDPEHRLYRAWLRDNLVGVRRFL